MGRTGTRRVRVDDLDAHTLLVMRDKLQDTLGRDLGDWLTGYDFMPGYLPPQDATAQHGRNVGYWWVSFGGTDKRLCHLRSRNANLHRALATVAPMRWALRASHVFGWEPLPLFPYRLVHALLTEFGIPDADSYIKTGAHNLARSDRATGLGACGSTHMPFYATSLHDTVVEMRGRGYECNVSAYSFVTEIVGWANRLELRERIRATEYGYLANMRCPDCRMPAPHDNTGRWCPRCRGSRWVVRPSDEF